MDRDGRLLHRAIMRTKLPPKDKYRHEPPKFTYDGDLPKEWR